MKNKEFKRWVNSTRFNRARLDKKEQAGCIHCLAVFPTSEINAFYDEGEHTDTAECPRCYMDVVVPLSDPDKLREIQSAYNADNRVQPFTHAKRYGG